VDFVLRIEGHGLRLKKTIRATWMRMDAPPIFKRFSAGD
jgi:hypothetical protein